MNERGIRLFAICILVGTFSVACSSTQETQNSSANPATSSSGTQGATTAARADGSTSSTSSGVQPSPQPALVQPAVSQAAKASEPKKAEGVTPASTNRAAVPKLVLSTTKIDFGKQPKQRSISRSITVRNIGKAELRIDAVEPGWGCTTVDFPKVLPPGKAGTIKVKVDTGNSPGEHTKAVTIRSNDPAQPTAKVEFVFVTK